jgi:hypothetical protein
LNGFSTLSRTAGPVLTIPVAAVEPNEVSVVEDITSLSVPPGRPLAYFMMRELSKE